MADTAGKCVSSGQIGKGLSSGGGWCLYWGQSALYWLPQEPTGADTAVSANACVGPCRYGGKCLVSLVLVY